MAEQDAFNADDRLAIQQAAVLLSSLPESVAAAVLERLQPEHQDHIRQILPTMGTVSAEERERIRAQFLTQFGSFAANLSADQDADARPADAERFANWSAAELLELLRDEHPQTRAAVVARLSPDQAAEYLQRLAPEDQTDLLRRLMQLESTDEETLTAIEEELSRKWERLSAVHSRQATGSRTVAAILEAAPAPLRSDLLSNVSRCDAQLADTLGPQPPARSPAPTDDPDAVTARLEQLGQHNPDLLALACEAVPEDVLVLALVGASRRFRSRIVDRLHPARGRRILFRVQHIGPVRLADLQQAQMLLLQAAHPGSGSGTGPGHIRLSA